MDDSRTPSPSLLTTLSTLAVLARGAARHPVQFTAVLVLRKRLTALMAQRDEAQSQADTLRMLYEVSSRYTDKLRNALDSERKSTAARWQDYEARWSDRVLELRSVLDGERKAAAAAAQNYESRLSSQRHHHTVRVADERRRYDALRTAALDVAEVIATTGTPSAADDAESKYLRLCSALGYDPHQARRAAGGSGLAGCPNGICDKPTVDPQAWQNVHGCDDARVSRAAEVWNEVPPGLPGVRLTAAESEALRGLD